MVRAYYRPSVAVPGLSEKSKPRQGSRFRHRISTLIPVASQRSIVVSTGEGALDGSGNGRNVGASVSQKSAASAAASAVSAAASGCDTPLKEGRLVVEVVDTGAGISPENQKKLFKEIVQFNPEKLQAGGGSGLGLWITKGIVDMHGGRISVHSAGEGHGCTFTVRLPMYMAKDGSGGGGDGDKGAGQKRDGAATGTASSPSEAASDVELGRAVVAAADAGEEAKARASGGLGPALGMEPPAFPAHTGPPPAAAAISADAGAGTGALGPALTSAGCYHILVVDDSQLNRKVRSLYRDFR